MKGITMKSSLIAMFTLASLLAFSGIASAEETKAAPAAAKSEGAALHSVSCPDPCNFEVKSRNEKELISIVKTHAKKFHKMSMNDKQIKEMMK
jgi:predicted small metal-binding protein